MGDYFSSVKGLTHGQIRHKRSAISR